MSSKPIFVATHPRACSTAFERVFMTRRDVLKCAHEPFGDAFYYGPERLSQRFENDAAARVKSGFANTTYKDVMDRLDEDAREGKRLFIKDIAHYLFPPDGAPAAPAPSLRDANAKGSAKPGTGEDRPTQAGKEMDGTANAAKKDNKQGGVMVNPTVIPTELLRRFHFTFLIRHPRRAIPSYYRCTVPPLDAVTGFDTFMPNEAGYDELRRLFDFLKAEHIVGGTATDGDSDGVKADGRVPITVVDADDLLDKPEQVIRTFCERVGLDFTPDMLHWEDEENQAYAARSFEKWHGFHNDVIESIHLRPRSHGAEAVSVEEEDEQWRNKYGAEAQQVIRECVNKDIPDYEYLKSFAIKF